MVAQDEQPHGIEELFKVSEVAKLFDVTPYTVREWLKSGKMKGIKMGDGVKPHWRITKSEVNAFGTRMYGNGEGND